MNYSSDEELAFSNVDKLYSEFDRTKNSLYERVGIHTIGTTNRRPKFDRMDASSNFF